MSTTSVNTSNRPFKLIENYIYLYHTDEYLLLPTYPESITDRLSSTFTQTQALSRSAPIFTYSNSGPREVQITLELHREMMEMINWGASNLNIVLGDDYVDTLVKRLQAIALPKYSASSKSVEPPMVAVRFGDEIFIKGVVTSGISITYNKPILENNKYAMVSIAFTVSETDPYDALTVAEDGSFRGLTRSMTEGLRKE